jgi:hypothetical protein
MHRCPLIHALAATIAVASVSTLVFMGQVSLNLPDMTFLYEDQPIKLIDSEKQNFSYAYAPSIIYTESLWYAYYCSSGTGDKDWDNIRYSTSSDGIHWSPPTKILGASVAINERATCDPSVVRYNAGDGDYYYLFYSGNQTSVQTVNFVARSTRPSGPFLKLTQRVTWESNPPDPKIILSPLHAAPENSSWYGLGQPSVVAKRGKLYQWYTDTTSEYPSNPVARVYLSVSTDPANWPPGQRTDVSGGSVDVKYDARTQQFVMFELGNQHLRETSLQIRTSKDGITWSDPKIVIPAGSLPDFAHNVGVSGSAKGELDRNFVMIAYGAPYDLDSRYKNDCTLAGPPRCWGYWDLYGQLLKLTP